jgi:hypothetical protein
MQVPAEYFLLTFTLPAELRPLAFANQEPLYEQLLSCGLPAPLEKDRVPIPLVA